MKARSVAPWRIRADRLALTKVTSSGSRFEGEARSMALVAEG
jgi:hypothetical protein